MWRLVVCLVAFLLPGFVGAKEYGSIDLLPGNVRSVYDGDTFTVTVPGWPAIIGEAIEVRVLGIDTAERRGSVGLAKEKAEAARVRVVGLIRNAKAVRLERMQRDKYFRIDAVVLVDGVDLGALLLAEGLAKPWNGQGPRPKW